MIDIEEAETASAEAEAVEVIKLEAEIDRLRAELTTKFDEYCRNLTELAQTHLKALDAKDARIAELEARLKQYDRPVAIRDPRPEPPHNASGWPGEDQ